MSQPLFIFLCVFIVLFAGGCAYNLVINRQMERYVLKKARHSKTGIVHGAEPVFLENKSQKAVLLIHGFIGSPKDFGKLPEFLWKKGYTVSAPLLPGHGTDPRHFAGTTPEEFEKFVADEYKKMKARYQEVALAGFSMGGALAIIASRTEKVDRLVLLAPYLRISHQWYYIFPTELYQKLFLRLIPFVYRPSTFKQVNKKESVPFIVDYDYVSLKGGDTAIKIGDKALRLAGSIDRPTLIIHGAGDRATDFNESKKLYALLREKKVVCRLVALPRSNHMMFWDYDAEMAENEILNFLND